MPRQLGVGLLTKIARNGPSTNLVSPKSASPSSFLIPKSFPFHRRSLSEYSTLSRSHLLEVCCPNGLRGTIQNGALPTSLLATRVFSSALLQGRAKFPVAFRSRRSLASFSLDRRRRSFFRKFIPNGCVVLLIVTNVLVYLSWRLAHPSFMVKNFMVSAEHIVRGQLHTVITSAFSHIKTDHLIANMLLLAICGTRIARKFGPQYLLKLYLGGAISGSMSYAVCQAFLRPPIRDKRQRITPLDFPGQGASAAVNAIVLLDIFLFPPVAAFLAGMLVIEMDMLSWKKGRVVISIFPGMRLVREAETELYGAAHLGGSAAGAIAWLSKRKRRFGRF